MDEIEKITDELAEQLVCKLYENSQKDSVGMKYTFYSVTMDILAVMLLGDVLDNKETKDMMYKVNQIFQVLCTCMLYRIVCP